jgi:hypothetical protein
MLVTLASSFGSEATSYNRCEKIGNNRNSPEKTRKISGQKRKSTHKKEETSQVIPGGSTRPSLKTFIPAEAVVIVKQTP